MSTINASYLNFNSSLFSTSNTSSSGSSSNILGDYAAIKNGSYKKLLSAYYAKQESKAATSSSADDKNVTLMAQDAKELKTAADALRVRGEDSLFNKETITTTNAATGEKTETTDYNYDKIFDAAKSFVESYNSMLKSAGEVSATIVEKKLQFTTNFLQKNADLLKDIGVTVGSDGALSINETDFKKADISDLKTVFNGTNSIADKIAKRAGDIYSTAQKILSNTAGTYTSSGTLNNSISTGTLVDELV